MRKMNSFSVIIILVVLCFLKCIDEIRATDITTDEDALLALKAHITNDPQNLITSNWSNTTSVCNWIGITCGTRHRRVRGIALQNLSLTGTIPPQIGHLSFLVYFSLYNNHFQGSLPIGLANLRRLRLLDLGSNLFDGIIPTWIGFLIQLQYLDLSSNNFGGGVPVSLCNLSKLHHLYVGMNNLEGQIPDAIGNLQSLKFLSLSNNKLSGAVPIGEIPRSIGNLTQLRILDFTENKLTGSIPFEISNLPYLEELYLGVNDDDMVAHVSDFGIAKLIGEDQSFIQTMTFATVGYMAPEYGSEGLVSTKGDIYSLGILMMETFTRRRPVDEMFNEEMSMKKWIRESLPYGVTHFADPNLIRVNERDYLSKTDCISSIMELALKCCEDAPEERISSKEVASTLNKIKVKLLNDV
ncbi:Leucine-rich repeat protein kinase family protein [Euphorbia peplus]|nr:Leucine-rich repeat protein kinase family protein [Euphorbia peplus]